METALDLLAWRATLSDTAAGPNPDLQLDCARQCLAAGERAAAQLLAETAYLRCGFSPQHRAEQAQLGLWGDHRAAERSSAAPGASTIDLALAELNAAARRLGEPSPRADARPPVPTDLASLASALFTAFRAGEDDRASDALAPALAQLAGHRAFSLADCPPFAPGLLPLLASGMALSSLHAFLAETHDLQAGPLGGPVLLHAAARFDSFGLGPWFGNIGRIARNSRDVIELARIAYRASGTGSVGAWVALLARKASGGLLHEVVDDLGDIGASDALAAMLARTSALPDTLVDQDLVMRVRDAALDNLDFALAAQAQAVTVRLHPDRVLERVILGTIQASGGETVMAADTFQDCLLDQPDDRQLPILFHAAKANAFAPYALRHGYGSPPGRREYRIARRGDGPVVRSRSVRTSAGPARVEFY